jgi:uncharacterized protein
VWQLAKNIGQIEGADLFIVEMAALLHDVSDFKFNDSLEGGKDKVIKWLEYLELDNKTTEIIWSAVETVSFKGAGVDTKPKTLEGMIVQDADRLDAMGAVGIARTFAYGGHSGREIYNPDIKPVLHQSFDDYKKNQSPSINHFYEKLLLLKNLINTATGKKIAEKRHKILKEYLEEFLIEWEGKDI